MIRRSMPRRSFARRRMGLARFRLTRRAALSAGILLGLVLVIVLFFVLRTKGQGQPLEGGDLPQGGAKAAMAAISPTPSPTPVPTPVPTPFVMSMRFVFSEKHINQPVYYDGQLLFSAGTGSPDTPVLRNLILVDVQTGDETVVATSRVAYGEIYEPQLNANWIIWLDTDHGGNSIIWALDRNKKDAEAFQIKTCRNGKPKLRLSGDTLVWMEPVSNEEDKLYLFDLVSQENLPLTNLKAPSTYGVSAPGICGEQIIWAAPDEKNAGQSVIYSFRLDDDHGDGEDFKLGEYRPGMYVHEPVTKGRALAWIDTNKSPEAKLFFALDLGKPALVDEGVSTYAMGDGFLVYGKKEEVWVYSWATGEKQIVSRQGEQAILPTAFDDFVIWYEMNAPENKDVVKMAEIPQSFKGMLTPTATPTPTPTPTPKPAPTPDPNASVSPEASPAGSAVPSATTAPDEASDPAASNSPAPSAAQTLSGSPAPSDTPAPSTGN